MTPFRHLRPALLTICLAGCRDASPEAQVKAAFARCVDALEAGDAGTALEVLAPDFQGPEGLDRASARLYLMGLLRREKVGVTVFSNDVELQGKRVRQRVEVVLTSRTPGGLLPQDAGHRRFELVWVEVGGAYRLQRFSEAP
jgi:hypothetical protein